MEEADRAIGTGDRRELGSGAGLPITGDVEGLLLGRRRTGFSPPKYKDSRGRSGSSPEVALLGAARTKGAEQARIAKVVVIMRMVILH